MNSTVKRYITIFMNVNLPCNFAPSIYNLAVLGKLYNASFSYVRYNLLKNSLAVKKGAALFKWLV